MRCCGRGRRRTTRTNDEKRNWCHKAPNFCRRLRGNWWNRIDIHDWGYSNLVFHTSETFFHSSQLVIRTNLDYAIPSHGNFSVPDLEKTISQNVGDTDSHCVWFAACSKCSLECCFLWFAPDFPRPRRNSSPMGGNCVHNRRCLQN